MAIENVDIETGKTWIKEAGGQAGGQAEGKGGTRAAASAASAARTGGKEAKNTNRISILDLDPLPVEINIPGEETEKPKRKKKARTKKEEQSAEMEMLVHGFLSSIFYLAAAKSPDIWQVSEAEIESIARPAGKILIKLDKSGKVSEYSDGLSLVLAVLMVVGVRAAKTIKQKKGGVTLEPKATNQGGDRQSNSGHRPAAVYPGHVASVMPTVG